MPERVLYEAEVTDLKMEDKNKRILRFVTILANELALLFLLGIFLGIIGLIIGAVVMWVFLPFPLVRTPNRYQITNKGIICDGNRYVELKTDFKFKLNEERKLISIYRGRKEILNIYSPEPDKVLDILNRLVKRLQRMQGKRKAT